MVFILDHRKVQGHKFKENFSDATCDALAIQIAHREGTPLTDAEKEAFDLHLPDGTRIEAGSKLWCAALREQRICWMPSQNCISDFVIGGETDGNTKNIWSKVKQKPILANEWLEVIVTTDTKYSGLSFDKLNIELNKDFVKIAKPGLLLMRNDRKLGVDGTVEKCDPDTVHFAGDDSNDDRSQIWTLEELIDSFHCRNQAQSLSLDEVDVPRGLGGDYTVADDSLEDELVAVPQGGADPILFDQMKELLAIHTTSVETRHAAREATLQTESDNELQATLHAMTLLQASAPTPTPTSHRRIAATIPPTTSRRRIAAAIPPTAPRRRIAAAIPPTTPRRRIAAAIPPTSPGSNRMDQDENMNENVAVGGTSARKGKAKHGY